ncbi:MAG: hypothetical protein IJ033_04430 [Clostridia bacterium]|nr:hypothetical protein [Clostridia bacterium]
MAQPATPGCLKGCIIGPIITIIAVILIIVIAAVVVVNLTPDQLGIADLELFEGETLRTLGLADVKIKDVFSFIDTLMNPNEEDIVQNPVDNEVEKGKADAAIEDSSVAKKDDGTIDYSSIVTDKIIYPTTQEITYSDTTLAYIFNQMVSDGAESSDEAIKFLQDLDAKINEVTIAKDGDNWSLRIVASIETTAIAGDINATLDEMGVGGLFTLPEKVYAVSYSTLSLGAEGLETESVSLKINDSDNPMSKAIMKVLAKKANETAEQEGQEVDTSENAVNDEIGNAFVSVVTNLGKPIAIQEHAIVVETYTE